ncbi:hypothetical protein HPULCUR_010075 [Helicostylum pulchrum]|uniref:Uncharacterized protein n=1 Tax=Helicostylum pulchrum TaxID=562976 RepID=A0ABP9YC87_9FUNG
MNHYYTRLSFEKLENFDMQKSSLSSFVLVRNSLITALTMQQHFNTTLDPEEQDDLMEEEEYDSNMMLFDQVEEEQQVWLDSCFTELDQVYNNGEEDSDEEEDDNMPTSPQDDNVLFYNQLKKKTTFYINEEEEDEEDGLICYDIPFLSLVDGQPTL